MEQDEIQDVEGRCLPCVGACAALERHFTTEKWQCITCAQDFSYSCPFTSSFGLEGAGSNKLSMYPFVTRPVNPSRGLVICRSGPGECKRLGLEWWCVVSIAYPFGCVWLELEKASSASDPVNASDSRFQWTWTVRFQMPDARLSDKMLGL